MDAYATHKVLNQSGALEGDNPYADGQALVGSAHVQRLARQANRQLGCSLAIERLPRLQHHAHWQALRIDQRMNPGRQSPA